MSPPRKNIPPSSTYEEDNNSLHNWRPVPDPTILTTQQLLRELASLKEVILTRMDAYDKAIEILQEFSNRQPTIAEVVADTKGKFQSLQMQLHERDVRFDMASRDVKMAVDSAFAASKEAVTKSEVNVTKTIDNIIELIRNSAKAQDEKINDLRDRLTIIEGRGQAYSQGFGWIATSVGIVAAIVGATVAVFFEKGGVGQ